MMTYWNLLYNLGSIGDYPMSKYIKPAIIVDNELAEGVFLAGSTTYTLPETFAAMNGTTELQGSADVDVPVDGVVTPDPINQVSDGTFTQQVFDVDFSANGYNHYTFTLTFSGAVQQAWGSYANSQVSGNIVTGEVWNMQTFQITVVAAPGIQLISAECQRVIDSWEQALAAPAADFSGMMPAGEGISADGALTDGLSMGDGILPEAPVDMPIQ